MIPRRVVPWMLLVVVLASAGCVAGQDAEGSSKKCATQLQRLKEAVEELNAIDAAKTFQNPTVRRVAYHKTHKTGSTTIGNILFHHAARNNMKVFKLPGAGHTVTKITVNPQTSPADMCYYHFSPRGAKSWEEMRQWYNSTVPGGQLLTIIREPVSRYLSYFYFFVEPTRKNYTLEQWVEDGRGANGGLADFKVLNEATLDQFLHVYVPEFKVILITNRIIESLVVWAFEYNWPLTDMLHISIHDSHDPNGLLRWDKKPVRPTPRVSEVPAETVKKIKALTQLDQRFYDYVESRLNQLLLKYGQLAARGVTALKAANKAFDAFCSCDSLNLEERKFCEWSGLEDMKYEKAVSNVGQAPLLRLPEVGL